MRAAVFVIAAAAAIPSAWARPRPVPIPAVLVDAGQCRTHLVGDRRAACTECTRNGGQFHTQGVKGPGVCRRQPAPEPAARPARAWLTQEDQCGAIERPDKRRRCQQCVRGGNRYLPQGEGWGYCKVRPGQPSPIWLARPERCSSIERPDKRRRCEQCVRAGHRYLAQGDGWGYCKRKPAPAPEPTPPPPPPPREVARATGADQCNSSELPRPLKRRCLQCVRKGGAFTLDGSARCVTAPPPPPPPRPAAGVATSVEQCDRALPGRRRRPCHECVQKGGTYKLEGRGECQRARRRHR